MSLGKSSPPPSPDYTGAAIATASGNLDATRAAANANRINQYTPYGSLTYAHNPSADNPDSGWSQTVDLSPTGQQLLNYQNQAATGLGQQTGNALGRVDSTLAQPFDFNSVGDVQNAAQNAILSRVTPQLGIQEDQLRTKLATQGIPTGSEAWNREMDAFGRQKNDAMQQAVLGGINTMPQTFQLASSLRNQPLNELSALRTGAQVTNPTFQNVPMQGTTQGADLLGAAGLQNQANIGQYNANSAQSNALMGGLFSLGGAALGSPYAGKMFGF